MTIFQAIILGLVQGLTEFLPVSSSGHLVLFQNFFGLTSSDISFEIALHFSTLLAIIVFFYRDILKLKKADILALLVATLPAMILGFLLKKYVEQIFSWPILVPFALLLTGAFNLMIDKKISNKELVKNDKQVKVKDALVIGLMQAVAIIPGISRSASTVLAALNQKLDRQAAFRFSFILAIPAILGASILQIWQQPELNFTNISVAAFLAGGISAFLLGLASLYLFRYLIEKAKFEYFAYYCFFLAGFSLLMQII